MIWLLLVGTLFGACCFLFTWACRSISFCGGVGGNICFKTFLWFFSTAFLPSPLALTLDSSYRHLAAAVVVPNANDMPVRCRAGGEKWKSIHSYRVQLSWPELLLPTIWTSSYRLILAVHTLCVPSTRLWCAANEWIWSKRRRQHKEENFFCVWNIKTFELGCGDDDDIETGSHWRLVD